MVAGLSPTSPTPRAGARLWSSAWPRPRGHLPDPLPSLSRRPASCLCRNPVSFFIFSSPPWLGSAPLACTPIVCGGGAGGYGRPVALGAPRVGEARGPGAGAALHAVAMPPAPLLFLFARASCSPTRSNMGVPWRRISVQAEGTPSRLRPRVSRQVLPRPRFSRGFPVVTVLSHPRVSHSSLL